MSRPFINEARQYLPPPNIIWTKMQELKGKYAPNSPYAFDNERFVDLCVKSTEGHEFHIVEPMDGEVELSKNHPSAFHVGAHTYTSIRKDFSLHTYLQATWPGFKRKIETVVAIGVIDSRCVGATLGGASERGYNCLTIDGFTASPEMLNLAEGAMSFNDEARAHRQVRDMFIAASILPGQFIDCIKSKKGFTP